MNCPSSGVWYVQGHGRGYPDQEVFQVFMGMYSSELCW